MTHSIASRAQLNKVVLERENKAKVKPKKAKAKKAKPKAEGAEV